MSRRRKKSPPPPVEPVDGPEPGAEDELPVAGEAPPAPEPEAVEVPETGVEDAPDEAAEWRDKYMRALADLDNYRKRVERERAQHRQYALEGLLRDLLPVVDALECAAGVEGGDRSIREGVELALNDLLRILGDRGGLERIECVGQPFDPRWHEALAAIPTTDHEPGTVIHEMRSGYRLHDRVLRASRVHIAVAPPEPAEREVGDEEGAEADEAAAGAREGD